MASLTSAVSLTLVLLATGALALGQDPQSPRDQDAGNDPCHKAFDDGTKDFPDDLRGVTVDARLVAEFGARNFTCVGAVDAGVDRILGVFSEFADDDGTVMVAATLHGDETASEWQTYLDEIFRKRGLTLAFTEAQDGHGVFAWVHEHPRVEHAQARQATPGPRLDIADIVGDLRDGRPPRDPR